MQVPSPNLDDRTFEELVETAKRRIPALCPRWTDFNSSDPGMTLVELMAWMTELLIYRINRVPDKSYIEFLNLMGVRLRPPEAARAWVTFTPAAGAARRDLGAVEAGAKLSTAGAAAPPVDFETLAPLNLTAAKLIKAGSRHKDRFQVLDLPDKTLSPGIFMFGGDQTSAHRLYLGDTNLQQVAADMDLTLHLTVNPENDADVTIEWECWNGRQWEIVVPKVDETRQFRQNGIIRFDRIPKPEPCKVHGHDACWLRACLLSAREQFLPRIESLLHSLALKAEQGRAPDKAMAVTAAEAEEEEPVKKPVDLIGEFYPFGPSPQPGNTLYLASRLFEKRDAHISIQVSLSAGYHPASGDALHDLKVAWEYPASDGQWKLLGLTTPFDVKESLTGFRDDTQAFTHSGRIRFRVPPDMAAIDQTGDTRYWIRVRVHSGGYGDNPPLISSLRISFVEKQQGFDHYLAENYDRFVDVTPQATASAPFTPFELEADKDPAFYLAMDRPLGNTLQRIYFRLADNIPEADIDLLWEYAAPHGWRRLNLKVDGTGRLCHSGAIEFIGPADWERTTRFKAEGYWLRVRWVSGQWSKSPLLIAAHLNAVPVIQAQTCFDIVLGTGNGQPDQVVYLPHHPILPDPQIFVRELDDAPDDVRQARAGQMDEEDFFFSKAGSPGIWIRWQAVENFYRSGPDSRHFMVDLAKGSVTFGNGIRGRRPSIGTDNILARLYRIGGGAMGNVGADCITVLKSPFPGIQEVTNPEPATGGADAESVAEARLRGPWVLKHRHRAVTREDFEQLALEASSQVAKATCISDGRTITVVIVPKGEQAILKPGVMLIRRVRDYLDNRRLLTTRLNVRGPDYLGVEIQSEVVLQPSAASKARRLQEVMQAALSAFFHPIGGGPDQKGWPMGRAVHLSEIYYLLETVEGVDYVKSVVLDADTWRKRIGMEPCQYPFLKSAGIVII